MASTLVRINAAENGYVIEICGRERDDPPPAKGMIPMPEEETYIANSVDDVVTFITNRLPNLVPYDADEEYGMAFKDAEKEDD